MAMEFGAAIFRTIVDCVFKSTTFSYLRKYDDNIVALGSQLQTLEKRENDVHEAIEVAKGKVIAEAVQDWITRVDKVKMEARNFLKDDVEVNKRRVRGWFPNLKTRYSLSKEAMEKHEEIEKLCGEQAQFGINFALSAPRPRIDFISSKDFVLFQTTKLAMEEIMAALRDDSSNFVGIHGMGGAGKTTLVKAIARKCGEEKLFDYVGMAMVSQTSKVEHIQEELANFLRLKLDEKGPIARASRLYVGLKSEKKALVILDDVWAKPDLSTIGIPSGEDHKGCKVVITTRRRQVCTAMGDTSVQATRIVNLDVLNEQESWDLFKKQVGDIIECPEEKIAAKKLVKECGGLPIALVTVGNAMRGKHVEEWKEAALELKKSSPTNIEGMEKNVFKCIKSSYDYLENEEEKAYFLLCCLFPKDCDIQIERSVRYGVVLNTFTKMHKIQEARRRAHSTINKLKSSSLLMASERDGCIKMHGVIRNVAKTIASGKYFVEDDEVSKEWPKKLRDEYKGSGISLVIDEIQKYPKAWECPKLEIFLIHDYSAKKQMPYKIFRGMRKLRVLNQIHKYPRKRSLEPTLSQLTNLRTLIIEGIDGKMEIWGISALRELKKLQVVSFRNCIFGESLDALRKLRKLRLLDLEYCVNCSSLFNHTRTLTEDWNSSQLQELRVSEPMSCSVAELINCHPRLNVLWFCIADISWIPENFDLSKFDNFAINVGSYRHDFAGGYLENILHLDGKDGRLDSMPKLQPNRIGKLLPGVSILTLHRFKGFENILPYLLVGKDSLVLEKQSEGKSLKVKKLEVKVCPELKFLIDTPNRIPQPTYLEEVRLWNLQSFRGLCGMVLADMANSFSGLKDLHIQSCPEMSNIGIPFNFLRRMRQLEVLKVYDCKAVQFLFELKEEVEDAVEKEEEGVLVNLRRMTLDSLYNLEQLWRGPIGLVHLCNMKTVYISKCPKLRVLFHWSVAQRLEQLEELKVVSCYELEEILQREPGKKATGLEPFSSLKKVEIRGCPKLRVVFHWSAAQRLKQLEELTIDDCQELQEIVERETGEEAVRKAFFPELQYLDMSKLPKLVGFYTGNLPKNQGTPKLKTVRMPGVETLIEPEVKIAVGDNNLDTVIKEHKALLR